MFSCKFIGLRNLHIQNNLCVKIINIHCQQKFFSNKPPIQQVQKSIDDDQQKKPKKQPIPKITLIASNDNISITTIEEAQHLSKRRDLKLVKILDLDTKTQRPVYKLMSGAEYHAEELKQREERKIEKQTSSSHKGEKLLMLNAAINKHDLETYVKKISKWISKKYEVRVVINGAASNMEKTEGVYTFLEDCLKDHTRFLQKRTKGNDMKFQIISPKGSDGQNKNL